MSYRVRGLRACLLAAMLSVAACNTQAEPTATPAATPVPAIPLNAATGDVRASGTVEPARRAALSFAVTGRVDAVDVAVGDVVDAGAPLIRLEQTDAAAAVEEASAALFKAQAARQDLVAGPRAAEIEIAQAQLDAAQARLAQLAESARPEDVAAARAELRAAQSAYQQLYEGPQENERIAAQAALAAAKATLRQAQSAYNEVAWQSNVGMLPESRDLEEATIALEAAQARYDALFADPTGAAATAAQARIAEAEAALERLLAPGSEGQVAEAAAQVRSAQAQLDLLTGGARDGELAAAAVAVTQAEAALARAQAKLDALTLTAPFAGTVTAVDINPGEMAQPGVVVLTLADLAHLQVETTDLSERDVARVAVGQSVDVLIEALSHTVAGVVTQIAPQADIIGGDVVYTVKIQLDEQPAGLRWGMSADVDIRAE
ncbi:MAG: efflux RND transporter periplasmic adaptor subunit [Caldilineaceae bacterium]|nr:efflux RND transporter periplasmic adaptor subunit [Caldilineaceae bacterium]